MGTTAATVSGAAVLKVEGDLIVATAGQFRRAAQQLLDRGERDFVVDLSDVTAVDSSGLESLTWLLRESREHLGNTKLCGADAATTMVLRMTRLDQQFECFADVDQAAESYG
jgi:anti-anti-sigma factor